MAAIVASASAMNSKSFQCQPEFMNEGWLAMSMPTRVIDIAKSTDAVTDIARAVISIAARATSMTASAARPRAFLIRTGEAKRFAHTWEAHGYRHTA
eukprot:6208231-Pleurochrysis_carterae.AAC.1